MVAEFLHFFPGYRLEHLETMPAQDFHYLLGGMKDLENPESTMPLDELVKKRMAEKQQKYAKQKPRRR